MDDSHFDDLTRCLAGSSRRSLFAAMATAIGAALFGDDASDEALAKRTKRTKRKHAKRKHAKTRRSAPHARLAAEGRKKRKKKRKKKPTAAAPPQRPGPTPPPPGGCTPDCAGKACGAPDGCDGTCQTGSCSGGQACQHGQCVSSCDAGFTLCGSQCVDTQANASHCGGCNQPCAVQAPETCGTTGQCVGGVCQQYGQGTVCQPETCLDAFTSSLPSFCGGRGPCGAPVPVDCRPGQCDSTLSINAMCRFNCSDNTECSSDGWCDGNQCRFKRDNGQPCSASTPQMCASGFCVDGVCCEHACNAPPNAQRSCAGGACAFTCNTGFTNCDGDWANGCETDLTTTTNCGQCGNRCPTTNCGDASEPRFWACVNGSCECMM